MVSNDTWFYFTRITHWMYFFHINVSLSYAVCYNVFLAFTK